MQYNPGFATVVSNQPSYVGGGGFGTSQITTDSSISSGYPNSGFGGGMVTTTPAYGGGGFGSSMTTTSTPGFGGGFGSNIETTTSSGFGGGFGSNMETSSGFVPSSGGMGVNQYVTDSNSGGFGTSQTNTTSF